MKKSIYLLKTLKLRILLIAFLAIPQIHLFSQTPLKPSTCVNLDFKQNNFNGWVGRTTVYPPNWKDANNCNQNAAVNVNCTGSSGPSCNGCYSGCAFSVANGGPCPSAGNPLNVPVPGVTPNCMNPPMNYAGGSLTGNYYNNTGIVPGRHTIITSSVPDPYTCNNVMTLPAGDFVCARLGSGGMNQFGTSPVNPNNNGTANPFIAGNTGVGYEIDYLSYTFQVTPANSLLTYKYAVVLQDPLNDPNNAAHTDPIRPRFNVFVRDSTLHKLIDPVCGEYSVKYAEDISGFRECPVTSSFPGEPTIASSGGTPFRMVGTAYRAWTTVSVDLRKQIGNLVTITFNTWDCGWGGHFGYAYVTARCDSFAIQQTGCNPDGSVTLTAPAGFSYSWIPGGQTTQSVNVKAVKPGDSVQVILTTANGCSTDIYTVISPTTTKAKILASPLVACIQGNTNFTFKDSSYSIYSGDGSKVPIVKWDWRFGDGGTSTDKDPTHSYTKAGTYTVTLAITNSQGCMDSTQQKVVVLPPPIASFSTEDVCTGNPVIFQDLSTTPAGVINQWSWSFGDGGTSVSATTTNPSHTYTATGAYNVRLYVTTDVGCFDDTTITVRIWPKPKAIFSVDTVCLGDSSTFRDLSLNGDPLDPIQSWRWTFGDLSSFSGAQHPRHIYGIPNAYNALLHVTSTKGCVDTTSLSLVVNPIPKANFSFTPICLGAGPVTFTDNSTGGTPSTWNWNFGDPNAPAGDNTSTLQNPVHSYSTAGTYTISLRVSNQQGCIDSIQKIIAVLPPPVANFTTKDVCPGVPVIFQDLSTTESGPINYQWSWSFGDGSASVFPAKTNPSHTYTATGTYTVHLHVESEMGCYDDTTMIVTIWPNPKAIFSANTVCFGDSTKFTNSSLPGSPLDPIQNQRWTFGDGSLLSGDLHPSHMYGAANTYTVKLTTTSQKGCVDDTSVAIVVNPLPLADFTANPLCFGVPVNFEDKSTGGTPSTWNWNFGDPNALSPNNTSALQNPTHSYSVAGSYIVTLKVSNLQGCVDSTEKTIYILPAPVSRFYTKDVCIGSPVIFQDLSIIQTGPIKYQWSWSFGDGATEVSPVSTNPSHTYTSSGTYTVNLRILTDVGCYDDTSLTVTVWPNPKPLFTSDTVCVGDSTQFRDLSLAGIPTDPIKSWVWIFGDNSALDGNQHPQHLYESAQTFSVIIIVTTQKGCVKDTLLTALVNPLPVANFSATPLCFGVPANFTDLSTPSGIISKWNWNFGDPNATPPDNISAVQNPIHTYTKDGIYPATLIVSTKEGCMDTIVKPVAIFPLPEPVFDANRYEGCVPLCVNFYDLSFSPKDSIVKWKWTYGDGNQGTVKRPPHCYQDTGKFTVSYTITTANGCEVEKTWDDMIWVHPFPQADFSPTPTSTTESAPTVIITDKAKGAITWLYDLGDGNVSSDKNPTHNYPKAGDYTIWQYVINQWGCRDSIAKTIIVKPEWSFFIPDAFSPNGDGKNEGFIGKSWNVIEHQMWVFDRWGNMIYTTGETVNPESAIPWDGKANDGAKKAQEDVYVWVVKLKDIFGKPHKYIGHVTLVR